MKKIMTIAMLLCAMATTTAFAAGTNDDNNKCAKTEQCAKNKKCDKDKKCGKDKKCDKKCDRTKQKCAKGDSCRNLSAFKGITLTTDQQSRLNDLRKESRKERRNVGTGDSTRRMRPDAAKMRSEYIHKVKEILTPEQYVVFLENIAINGQGRNHRPGHDGKHMKKAQRLGGRPDRQPAATL